MARKKKGKKKAKARRARAKPKEAKRRAKRRAARAPEPPAPAVEPEEDDDELDDLDEDGSPVGAAIEAALAEVLGDRPPDRDYGTILSWDEGGPDPVDRISAFAVEPAGGGQRHWLLVTHGLTERLLDLAVGPGAPDGLELTVRVARGPREQEPPAWTLALLQGLVRHVVRGGEPPASGGVRAPLSLQGAPWLGAVAFRPDPDLQPRGTPWGRLGFLQCVHLTLDELALAQRWSVGHVVDALAALEPALAIDPARPSLLADAGRRAALEARAAAGSGSERLVVRRLDARSPRGRLVLTIDATSAAALAQALDGRTARGAPLEVVGPTTTLRIEPVAAAALGGDRLGAFEGGRDGGLVLRLPPALVLDIARDLSAHAPRDGRLQWPGLPEVTLILAPDPASR